MSTDDLIRKAVEGGMQAFNLYPCPGGWQTNVTYNRTSWQIGINADPIKAIEEALGPMAVRLGRLGDPNPSWATPETPAEEMLNDSEDIFA